jgi:hypothetical protein
MGTLGITALPEGLLREGVCGRPLGEAGEWLNLGEPTPHNPDIGYANSKNTPTRKIQPPPLSLSLSLSIR